MVCYRGLGCRLIWGLLAATLVATLVAGGSAQKNQMKTTIVVMPKLVGSPYFNVAEVGAKKAGQDLGVEVLYLGPSTPDAAEQVRMIEDVISKGVKAIAVSPNDAAALSPVLRKAKAAGVVVLDWDSAADQSVVELSIRPIDDAVFGYAMVDALVAKMGQVGDYAIITGGLSASNLNGWIDRSLERAKSQYPQLRLVTERVPSDEKQQLAYTKTLELVKAYPNLKGILAYSTPANVGSAQAIEEKQLGEKITVVGTGTPNDSSKYLHSGALDAAILWDPAKLCYLAVFAANELLNQRSLTDGQDVPTVGKVRVNGKVVIMGDPQPFTRDNVDQYNF